MGDDNNDYGDSGNEQHNFSALIAHLSDQPSQVLKLLMSTLLGPLKVWFVKFRRQWCVTFPLSGRKHGVLLLFFTI